MGSFANFTHCRCVRNKYQLSRTVLIFITETYDTKEIGKNKH